MASPTTTTTSAPSPRRALFVLFGDSLTEMGSNVGSGGWVALLQQAHVRSVDVMNRGLSGYSMRWFLQHAMPSVRDELQHSLDPTLITLWFGANDAALPNGPSAFQHVPLDEYTQSLRAIVQEFQQLRPRAKILVISPPVVDDDRRRRINVEQNGASPSDPIDRTNDHAAAYARACVETVASLEGVAVLDMHSFLMTQYPDATARAKLLSDGLHFTPEGNRVVFQELQRVIRTLLPHQVVDAWRLPEWRVLC